jgi:putative nucleotidyltransferase with HDIG domain
MSNGLDVDPVGLLAARGHDGYVVGGAVRDWLLGRTTTDFDVAVAGAPRAVARDLARATRAHVFELSEGFGSWRVVARDRAWQLDVLPLAEGDIERDLALRDFTINAMAWPLNGGLDDLVDPFGGRADAAAGRMRMVAPGAFAADPLRVLRVVRLACELAFEVDTATAQAARASAPDLRGVAAERVFAELRRIVIGSRAVAGLALLDELDATPVILPELDALHGVGQSQYHHLDVAAHTRAVLEAVIALEADPARWFGDDAPALHAFLAAPLANELTRWQALRFGAIFHDIAKPQTRAVTAEGRTTFMAHDVAGAEVAASVLGRLRASQRLIEHVAALTRHHLRLGFLVHRAPLGRRDVYGYLRACEPVEIDVTVLSVADRVATRGRGAEPAIERHVALARRLLSDALRWRAARPRPPLRGDELARELGIAPGPQIGALLRELEEACYAGEIESREQALRHARAVAGRGE